MNRVGSADQRGKQRTTEFTHSRRASITLEAIFAIPILLIGSIAIFEFGILMVVQQAVVTAATEGVREAAKGGDQTAVGTVVQQFLAGHHVSITPTGNARVMREQFGMSTTDFGNSTDLDCTAGGPTLMANEVRVTVCVKMSDDDNQPVPNWLRPFGFSLSERTFQVSAMSIVE